MQLVDQRPTGTFTTQELARLAVYRAAVVAGFYTDWDGKEPGITDTRLLARLLRDQPFSAEERRQLRRMRQRLAAGGFGDDRLEGTPHAAATDAGGHSLAE